MFNLRKKISKQCLLYLDSRGFTVLYYDRDHLAYQSAFFEKRSFDVGIQLDLKLFVEQHHLMKMPVSIVLGADQYQMILIDRPNVSEKELNQSVVWLVKDQMIHAADDVFVQTIEIPDFQPNQSKLYVVVVQKDILYALQQASEYADLKLSEVNIVDLSLAKLIEKEGHVCLFYQQADLLYFLCVNQGMITFRQEVGPMKDLTKATLHPLSLVCQRILDQYQVLVPSSLEKCYLTFDLLRSDFTKHVNLTMTFQSIPLIHTIAEFTILPEEFEKVLPLIGEMKNATEN